jgi:hypothetical protein
MAQFRHEQGLEMRKFKVRRQTLLEQLRLNKAKHQADYLESFEGFKVKAKEKLAKMLSDIDNAKPYSNEEIVLSAGLIVPVSFEKEYDEAITNFGFEVEEIVELDSNEMARYINDKWQWTEVANMTKSLYSSRR